MYCSAMTVRLLVGILTPAMRATVVVSCCRPSLAGRLFVACACPAGTRTRHDDDAHPLPVGPGIVGKLSPNGWRVLLDSVSFRQPPQALNLNEPTPDRSPWRPREPRPFHRRI